MRANSDRSYQTKSGRAIQKGFEEGGDTAGNMVMAAVTAPAVANAGLSALQLLASGQYASFAGGLLGSVLGGAAVEEGTRALTGKGYADHMMDAGMWPYNAYTSNPGAWVGGYYGTKAGQYMTDAALHIPHTRMAPTPNGMIEVPAGGATTIVESPTLVRSTTYGPTKYPARFTNKVVSGKTAADKGVWGGKNTYASRVGETNNGIIRGRDNVLTYTNMPLEPLYPTYPGALFPPVWQPTITPPAIPPVAPPAIIPPTRPTLRTKEVQITKAPFIKWFGEQPGGTYQWYDSVPGDPHRTGIYEIRRTVADPITVRTRVGTDPQHTNNRSMVANDSTTYQYYDNPFLVPDTGVTILPGAVAPITNIGPDSIPIQGADDPYGLNTRR